MEKSEAEASEGNSATISAHLSSPWENEPLPGLTIDVFVYLLQFLNARELGTVCVQVNSAWHVLSEHNWLWLRLCNDLWDDKAYVPDTYRLMAKQGQAKLAFRYRKIKLLGCNFS